MEPPDPPTCTPLPAPGSSVIPREGSLMLGASPSMQFTAFLEASSSMWRSHPPHLPPPGSFVNLLICFPCLVHQKRAAATEHLGRAEGGREHLGLRRSGRQGPSLITRRHPPSVTPPPVLRVVPKIPPRETSAASSIQEAL